MKFYCEKCAKPFPVKSDAAEGIQICPECGTDCGKFSGELGKGVVINDFLIEKLLSKGGMGEVFLARQISLDRPVALKVLQQKFIDDKEYVDSLFREARAAAKLNHPNIVQAYAVGEEDGIFYEQVILRDLEIVPIESFIDLPYEFCEEVATIGGSYKLTEYAVVGARAEIKHNEKSLAMGPQVGDGEVVRYFLVGKTDGDYYLFEIYWDDFLV